MDGKIIVWLWFFLRAIFWQKSVDTFGVGFVDSRGWSFRATPSGDIWPQAIPGGKKVPVEAKHITHSLLFHQYKGNAIRERHGLIGKFLHEGKGFGKVSQPGWQKMNSSPNHIAPPVRRPGITGSPRQQCGGFVKHMLGGIKFLTLSRGCPSKILPQGCGIDLRRSLWPKKLPYR